MLKSFSKIITPVPVSSCYSDMLSIPCPRAPAASVLKPSTRLAEGGRMDRMRAGRPPRESLSAACCSPSPSRRSKTLSPGCTGSGYKCGLWRWTAWVQIQTLLLPGAWFQASHPSAPSLGPQTRMRPEVKLLPVAPGGGETQVLQPLCGTASSLPSQLASDLLTSFFLSPSLAQWPTLCRQCHDLLNEQQERTFSQWE